MHSGPDVVAAAHALDGGFLFRAALGLAKDRPDAGIVLDRVVEFGVGAEAALGGFRLLDAAWEFGVADGDPKSSVGMAGQKRNSNWLAKRLAGRFRRRMARIGAARKWRILVIMARPFWQGWSDICGGSRYFSRKYFQPSPGPPSADFKDGMDATGSPTRNS